MEQAANTPFAGEQRQAAVLLIIINYRKLQTEKYYTQRRLDRLQQQLSSLTEGLQNRADLHFGGYIKHDHYSNPK